MRAKNLVRFGIGSAVAGAVLALAAVKAAETPPKTPVGSSRKTGNQLWEENCMRCHNFRAPTAYSRSEWPIVMHHMRVRANLTSEETRSILEFLKSAS